MNNLFSSRRVFILSLLILIFGMPPLASAENYVRAKIGVLFMEGDQTRLAKSTDSVKPGTQMQIHVIPEKNCFVYLINTDGKQATWLNWGQDQQQVPLGEERIFPSKSSLYQQNGSGQNESFTVICSPRKLNELTQLFSTRSASLTEWTALENKWLADSRIPLGETLAKPFGIAGSVRASTEQPSRDFKVYSGNAMLVKKYDFNVEK